MLIMPRKRKYSGEDLAAKPYCTCWNRRALPLDPCTCGEDNTYDTDWRWERPESAVPSWVVVSQDARQVMLHPYYSEGTAVVKGDTPLQHNYHYYWEVKMLSETYGTDISIGIGSNKVNIASSQHTFTSLLGQDSESYGLSYRGVLKHKSIESSCGPGFCQGTIIGIRVDMWQGTLEFYLNRESQGMSFYNLRRHETLYPMASSTAARTSLRLVCAASWRASLLVDAARALWAAPPTLGAAPPTLGAAPPTLGAAPPTLGAAPPALGAAPPGLRRTLRKHFWLTLPTGVFPDEDDVDDEVALKKKTGIFGEAMGSRYIRGFYDCVGNADRTYRLILWQ